MENNNSSGFVVVEGVRRKKKSADNAVKPPVKKKKPPADTMKIRNSPNESDIIINNSIQNQQPPDEALMINNNKDKIQTLLGFSVRAKKLIYGAEAIGEYDKKIHLIIVCPTIAQNSFKIVRRAAQMRGIAILKTNIPLEEIIFKTNCKAAALKDKQMANAIALNINDNYTLLNFAEDKT